MTEKTEREELAEQLAVLDKMVFDLVAEDHELIYNVAEDDMELALDIAVKLELTDFLDECGLDLLDFSVGE